MTMLIIEDHLPPGAYRGYVNLILDDPLTGEVYHDGHNTITLDAREIMAQLLGPMVEASVTYEKNGILVTETRLIPNLDFLITHMEWGSDNRATSRNDTGCYAPVIPTAIQVPSVVGPNSVTFQSSINPGEGPDDQEYGEVTLKTVGSPDGTVPPKTFARFAFPKLKKFKQLRLSARWQIFFS